MKYYSQICFEIKEKRIKTDISTRNGRSVSEKGLWLVVQISVDQLFLWSYFATDILWFWASNYNFCSIIGVSGLN